MDIMQLSWDGFTQACRVHPELVPLFVVGGGVSALAGYLARPRLEKLFAKIDVGNMIKELEELLLGINQILQDVLNKIRNQYPDKASRDRFLSGLQDMPPIENMNTRWETVWKMLLKVKEGHGLVLQLSYKDQKGRIHNLEARCQQLKERCTQLGRRVTSYSSVYYESCISQQEEWAVLVEMDKEDARGSGLLAP